MQVVHKFYKDIMLFNFLDTFDHCSPFPCTQPEAKCIDKPFGYQCICPLGWSGINCTGENYSLLLKTCISKDRITIFYCVAVVRKERKDTRTFTFIRKSLLNIKKTLKH